MFAAVNVKLGRAGYFLNRIKTLQQDISNFAVIDRSKEQEFRANLDGFFFEIISAKDFFLQAINDTYKLGLRKNNATDISRLKCQLGFSVLRKSQSDMKSLKNAFKVVESLERLLSDKGSWLCRLNNYRNSATHREILMEVHNIILPPMGDKKSSKIALQFPGQVVKTAYGEQKVDVPEENLKICLLENPDEPSKGHADIEVIPYCEESLTRMKGLLERLYSELGLE